MADVTVATAISRSFQTEIFLPAAELQKARLETSSRTDWQMCGFAGWRAIGSMTGLLNAVSAN